MPEVLKQQPVAPETSEEFNASEMAEIHENYRNAMACDQEDREAARKDVDMIYGDQWEAKSKRLRAALYRPILTWNRLGKMVDAVCNDGRQNKPSIKLTPADGGSVATAQLLQGRIRQIEYESDADIAYDTSRDCQVGSGRGFYRVVNEWDKPPKWKQIIRIRSINNQFSVLYDPTANEYDRSDADYCFVDTLMSKAEYKRKFNKTDKETNASISDFFDDTTNPAPDWFNVGTNSDNVRVAEYWHKKYTDRELCRLANGDSVWRENVVEGAAIVESRWVKDFKVWQYIVDGCEILDRTEFPVPYIPIIPLWGRQETVRGKKRNVSLIRAAHDAQRLINLYVSNIAEQIGQMPKTPYVGYEGQFDNFEETWKNINNVPKAYIMAKVVYDKNGNVLPLPRRENIEPPIQALSIGLNQAIDALKAACGIYDASLGAAPPDASGLAIQRRNTESDTGNFHFLDNESRSRKYAGRIIVKLIQKLEATDASMSVRSIDGKSTSSVALRRPVKHEDGTMVTHNIHEGDYEPHVSTGPSYTSQRQAAEAFYTQLANSDKSFMSVAGDLLFANSDMPGADELAARYKLLLDPRVQKPGSAEQLQGQLKTMQDTVHKMVAEIQSLTQVIESKKVESASRERIASMQEDTKRQNISAQAIIAEANLGMKGAVSQLQAQIAAIANSMSHVRSMAEQQAGQQGDDFSSLMDHYQGLEDPEENNDANNSPQSE